MSEQTALQKLDDAIAEYVREVNEQTLSGWVLAYQVSAFNADTSVFAVSTATDYSMAPSTHGETALGLLQLTSKRIERAVLSYDYANDEDDNE